MKMKLLLMVFALAGAVQAASPDQNTPPVPDLKPMPQQAQAAHLTAELLTRYHYKAMPLDDAMSEKIFDRYLKLLDPEKLFFIQSDIDQLSQYRTTLDDAILNDDLKAPFAIFNLYAQRSAERLSYARTLLKTGFDFRQSENYQDERSKEPWPKSEQEMREVWRKRVKNDWLRLQLAGKEDKSIVEILDKRYAGALKRLGQATSEDVFQTFMNAYTTAVEPHTGFMVPRAAADFDISMKLSLVGIGAVLAEQDDYTTIREFVPGGPAALSGQLNVGDRILGVGQGEGGVMTDIEGWRLDDAVALIRGAADSVVRLDVLPAASGPDGKHRVVAIVRKKVSLEEQSAKKTIVSVKEETGTRRIGVISLPGFYEDFLARQQGDKNFKSATHDVARLLDELKKEKVDGVLMDLRNNGGGSLEEAIELTGLFVGKGAVVQQRNAKGRVEVERNTTVDRAWDGPLGVLINRGSASASEIFAAAIQDYGRGVIIGEPSFGKGTVQSMIDLDQIAKNDKPEFGDLKLTIAQFFRVNGGTTQLRGVIPDIGFPATMDAADFGESSYDNALPWMQLPPADYSPIGNLADLEPVLQTRHEARVKNNQGFICLQESIANIGIQKKKNLVSLNESDRRRERDIQEARLNACEAVRKSAENALPGVVGHKSAAADDKPIQDDGLLASERNLVTELAAEKADKNAKDVLLDEAVHIIGDEADLLETKARLAGGPG